MVFAVALVVVRSAAHFALDHDDQAVTHSQLLGAPQEVGDPGEEFGYEFHLVGVIVRVAVELAN